MPELISPDRARLLQKRFRHSRLRRTFKVTIIEEESDGYLVNADYETRDGFHKILTVDMFRARDKNDVLRAIGQAAKSIFDIS